MNVELKGGEIKVEHNNIKQDKIINKIKKLKEELNGKNH
jgi:hypothetical protein